MKYFLSFLVFSTLAHAVDWQGHRGARGLYPENTIGAMEEALKYPVTTLELDVVVSKDQKVIVSHEPWMHEEICLDTHGKRVEGKKHNLYKMTYEEIQKFDCGSIAHPRFPKQQKVTVGKPTLTKLIEVIEPKLRDLNRTNIQYNIEIKSTVEDEKEGFQPDYKTFTDIVMKDLSHVLQNDHYTIQSFDWRVLKYLNEKYPDVRTVALYEGKKNPEDVVKELGFTPYVYSPYYKDLTADDVKKLHAMKMKVIPWTVNETSEMFSMLEMGVDGIITDYPNLIPEVIQKKCGKNKHLFENKCIKIPKNSLPTSLNPGWMCSPGYIQKRINCVKIDVPSHAHLLPDGKSWECEEGFKKYRSTCKKK